MLDINLFWTLDSGQTVVYVLKFRQIHRPGSVQIVQISFSIKAEQLDTVENHWTA